MIRIPAEGYFLVFFDHDTGWLKIEGSSDACISVAAFEGVIFYIGPEVIGYVIFRKF